MAQPKRRRIPTEWLSLIIAVAYVGYGTWQLIGLLGFIFIAQGNKFEQFLLIISSPVIFPALFCGFITKLTIAGVILIQISVLTVFWMLLNFILKLLRKEDY